VQAVGDETWFLSGSCAQTDAGTGRCTVALTAAKGPDPDAGARRLTLPDAAKEEYELHRVSRGEAYLLAGTDLWHTTDGAGHWEQVPLPKGCDLWRVGVAVAPEGEVWLSCQAEPTTAAEATLWRRTHDARWAALPEPPLFRYDAALTLLSPTRAFLTSHGRAGMYETRDGGRTWDDVLPYADTGYGSAVPGPGSSVLVPVYLDDEARGATSSLWRQPSADQPWSKVVLPPSRGSSG
jgi:hypothetical protein